MLEPWPDEPDEPSAETRWGNPERDLPRIPEVSTDERDVDPHTFKTFWVSVVFANAALFGASLGLMLWYFRGQALLGGSLVVIGLLAGARTYAAYRTFKTEQRATDGADQPAEADVGGGADGDGGTDDSGADEADAGTEEEGTHDAERDDESRADDADPPERNG